MSQREPTWVRDYNLSQSNPGTSFCEMTGLTTTLPLKLKPFNYKMIFYCKDIYTIVFNIMRFLLIVVNRSAVDLHPHLWVHNGAGLIPFWFRQLLS